MDALPSMSRSWRSVVFAIFQPSPRLPDQVRERHAHVREEHLVELGVPGHGAQRPHLDARRVHRDQHVRDARVLLRVGLGAHERRTSSAPTCAVLVQIFWPFTTSVVALDAPRRGEAREVGAGARLRVALAPDQLAAHRRRRSQRCFCSSLPCSSSVGTSMSGPWPETPEGTPAPRNSSAMIVAISGSGAKPPPPYAFGIVRAA